ncbi:MULTISPECIES: endonuclease MutS2 [Spirulina sp. CCY15215]|uniref:endonuclease MutS2 n=1 Tax=Spirulina sp. CCY15215 TaxID=2767591 RepID=UPI0019505FFB|nr:endonuclease MutS2 [Spirulina major]
MDETLELLEWPRLCQHLSTFTATKLGAIAARHLTPPASREETLILLEQTKEAYLLDNQPSTGISFDGIKDIGNALERVELLGTLSGEELLDIATTLAGMRRIRRVLDDRDNIPTLQNLVSPVRTYPELEREIHHCIDDRGQVTDRASVKLANIRTKLKSLRDKIYGILQRIIQRQGGAIQQPTITQRGDRYVLAVKAPQKDAIPGVVHDSSSTGSTLYIEPHAIIDLGNKLRQTQRQEKTEEEVILRGLTEKIAAVKDDLERLLAIATSLDLATAKARYSFWLEANPPRFIDPEEAIALRQLRHPLLIWQYKHEQGQEVTPIDVQIKPEIRVVAITGSNTGGKTVTLKTVGLAALMAKTGLFVPAREPVELPWFSRVCADIGDEQSLQQSLSTFSGHIRRIDRIVKAIAKDPQSLILLDEIGAGTDPAEGSALAIALLNYLCDRVSLTIASTHYGELKALKYQDSRFENASVEFDDVTLSPTYRLLWGIPGRSNALTIAGRLGLPEEIIKEAGDRVGGFSQEINKTIVGLEQQRKQQEGKAKEAANLLQQTEKFYQEVSQKAQSLQERERTLKLSQQKAVNDAIATAKAEITKVMRELSQQQTMQKAQKAIQNLQQIDAEYSPKFAAPNADRGYQPKVGEKVRIPRLGQTAEVLGIDDNGTELNVRFGLMKMSVPVTDIESLDGQKVETAKEEKKEKQKREEKKKEMVQISPPKVAMVRTSQNSVDIRGSRVFQAESQIEKAISAATQAGVLWVIHGKGTGRLRQGVHEFLERHPQVDRFELSPQNEGGSGVTIAYLN